MFINKQTLMIFLVQLIVFAGLSSIGVSSKYALDHMNAADKEHIQSLLDEKTESGFEAYESTQMVLEENPELIIEFGKRQNEWARMVAIVSLCIAFIFLYLSAVFISARFNKKT